MPTVMQSLRRADREGFKCLREMCVQTFLHGHCYEFAAALNEGLGWPMIGFMHQDTVFHVGVLTPKGMLFDVRGPVYEERFGEPYGLRGPLALQQVTLENLRAIRPVTDEGIGSARRMAEILFPRLPWKESHASKVLKFVDELEALSRKHGLWIRAPFPAQPPIIEKGDDAEAGYLIQQSSTGPAFSMDRMFKNECAKLTGSA